MSTRDHPDWWRPVGGQNSQDSTLERRSLMWNDDDILDGAVPATFRIAKYFEGKFFTRGCRGMIERIEVYCRGVAPNTIELRWSPHPGIGPFGAANFVPGAAWAWQGVAVEEMWNYDSLWIWIYYSAPTTNWAYDAVEPYDGHESADFGVTWEDLAIRPFIRVIYTGETPGDVPVSGIINNIAIPAVSSRTLEEDEEIPAGVWTPIVGVYGTGYCDYIKALVAAAVNSHLTFIRVECDLVVAMEEQFDELNTYGHTTATPTVSLPLHAADGDCYMLMHKRFEFRREFRVWAYNLPNVQTVTISIHPTLLR